MERNQKMLKLYLKVVLIAALVFLYSLILANPTNAQSNGLGVTPKESYTMKAGQQATNTLFLSNLNKTQPLRVKLTVVDFTSLDESGSAKLLQSSDQPETPWSLKPYITLPEFVTVEPGASKQIPFTLKLPANIGAGSYYSAISYTASTGSGSQQVTIAASTATLLFINVPGNVTEQLTLKQFGMFNMEKNKFQSFFQKPPTYFAYRIQNDGNLAESPAGTVVVKNIFGKIVAKVDNANPKGQLALIGQTRRFQGCNVKSKAPEELPKDSNCTPLKLSPGFYTANIVIFYGQNGQPTRQIGATSYFWYLPWSFIIIVVAVLLLLIYAIYRLYSHTRRRKRR